jgi:hypothetical protein
MAKDRKTIEKTIDWVVRKPTETTLVAAVSTAQSAVSAVFSTTANVSNVTNKVRFDLQRTDKGLKKVLKQFEPSTPEKIIVPQRNQMSIKESIKAQMAFKRQRNSATAESYVQKKVHGGTVTMQGGKILEFVGDAVLGIKNTKLAFNDENKLHGKCVIDGKTYNFQNGIKK